MSILAIVASRLFDVAKTVSDLHPDPPRLRLAVNRPTVAPQRLKLPVARGSGGTYLLVDRDGSPVWPVSTPREEQVLERVVGLFGGTSETVAARALAAPAENTGGLVVGIGDLQEEASLYAHLTDRRAEVRKLDGELSPDALPDVLLCCGPRLSRGLVQVLQLAPPRDAAVGIIWGKTREELRLQILARACGAYLNGPTQVPELVISEAGLENGAEGGKSIDFLRDRMGEGAGLLRLQGHSDGMFQWIGHGAALCSRGSEPEAGDPQAAPQCLATGFCHRLNEALETVSQNGRLIPPAAISARVVVHLSCHSAYLGSSALDQAWGLLPGLATTPYIGALVTTPALAFTNDTILENELTQFLRNGVAVGEAIAKLQENPTIKEIGYSPLLFGDPRVKGQPSSSTGLIHRDSVTRQRGPNLSPALQLATPDNQWSSDIELIRALSRVVPPTNPAAADTSEKVRQQLMEYEHAEENETKAKEAELQSSVLRHMAGTKVRLWEGWQGIAHIEQLDDLEQCPTCSWTGRPLFITLPSGGERELFDCPSCGEVFDQPVEDARLGMRAESHSFYLGDEVDRTRSAAAAYVVKLEPGETQTLDWPLDDQRLLQPQMTVDLKALQRGPVKIVAVLMHGLTLYTQSLGARGLGS